MNINELNQWKKRFDEAFDINEDNIQQKSLDLIKIKAEICQKYVKEKALLDKLNNQKNQLKGKLYHKYRYEFDYELKGREVEFYIDGNDEYHKKSLEIVNQQQVVDFFDKFLNTINTTGFAIKAYLQFLQLKMGMDI